MCVYIYIYTHTHVCVCVCWTNDGGNVLMYIINCSEPPLLPTL